MYTILICTCWAIVLLIRSVVFPRPRCCRNRGLLKVFIDVLFELLGFQKKKRLWYTCVGACNILYLSKLTLIDDAWNEITLSGALRTKLLFFVWRRCLDCDVVSRKVWKEYFDISPVDGHGMKDACHLNKALLSFIRQEQFSDKGFSSRVARTRIPVSVALAQSNRYRT